MHVFDGKKCAGTVYYNANDCVSDYTLLDSNGATLWASVDAATPEKTTNATTR